MLKPIAKWLPYLLGLLFSVFQTVYAASDSTEAVAQFENSVSYTSLSTLLASYESYKDNESKAMLDYLGKKYKMPELNQALAESVKKRSTTILQEIDSSIDKGTNTTIVFLGAGFTTLPYKMASLNNVKIVLVDFADVLGERRKALDKEQFHYVSIISADSGPFSEEVAKKIHELQNDKVIIVAEGLTLYLSEEQNTQWIESALNLKEQVTIVMDVYSCLISYFADDASRKEHKFLPNTDDEICTINSHLCKSRPYSIIYSENSYWVTTIAHQVMQLIPYLSSLSNVLKNASRIVVIKQNRK